MKRIIKTFILILSIFCLPLITEAATGKISAGDISMECTYDNGRTLTITYKNNAYGISISPIKLAYSITPPYSNTMTFVYKENEVAATALKNVECPVEIQSTLIEQKSKEGNNETSIQFEVLFASGYGADLMKQETVNKLKYISGFKPTSARIVGIEVEADSPLGKRVHWYYNNAEEGMKNGASFKFKLVAERIFFENDVEPYREWSFKNEGQQAASTPQYIRIYEYKNSEGTYFKLAAQNKILTKVKIDLTTSQIDRKIQFICFKPSVKSIVNDKSEMSYTFNAVSHDATNKISKKIDSAANYKHPCSSGYLAYREVNSADIPPDPSSGTSICEVLPETALLISTVIYYLGLIIPVILIILTGIDIGKLVISGDIEEELPKRRKLIIIRFIVAVSFFFIPIFLNIFVSSNYGTDFGDVSCLFAKNEPEEDNTSKDETGDNEPVDEEV